MLFPSFIILSKIVSLLIVSRDLKFQFPTLDSYPLTSFLPSFPHLSFASSTLDPNFYFQESLSITSGHNSQLQWLLTSLLQLFSFLYNFLSYRHSLLVFYNSFFFFYDFPLVLESYVLLTDFF